MRVSIGQHVNCTYWHCVWIYVRELDMTTLFFFISLKRRQVRIQGDGRLGLHSSFTSTLSSQTKHILVFNINWLLVQKYLFNDTLTTFLSTVISALDIRLWFIKCSVWGGWQLYRTVGALPWKPKVFISFINILVGNCSITVVPNHDRTPLCRYNFNCCFIFYVSHWNINIRKYFWYMKKKILITLY